MIFTTHIIILTHMVGRGRVRTQALRGGGAVIANWAFCQDPSAKWRLGLPLALKSPKCRWRSGVPKRHEAHGSWQMAYLSWVCGRTRLSWVQRHIPSSMRLA